MTQWPAHLPGHLDEPADGATLRRDPIWVRGWVPWFDDGPVRVEVRAEGRRAGLARIACPRPDVAALTDHPFAPICGFEFLLDGSLLREPSAVISALAHGRGGERRTIGERTVHLVDADDGGPEPLPSRRPGQRVADGGSPLRVVALSNDLGIFGATRFLAEMAMGLHGRGFSFRVLSLRGGEHERWLGASGIETSVLPAVPVDDPDAYEGWLDAHRGALADVDVVLPNTLPAFPLADLATRLGLPVVWPIHESSGLRPFWEVGYRGTMHPRVRALAEAAVRSATAVTFCSEATADAFRPHIDEGRIRVIRYGIAQDAHLPAGIREETRHEAGISADAIVLLCLGRIEERKGQGVLAQAFGEVARLHPDAVLVLVGAIEGDPLVPGLREHVRRAGLEDRVQVVPTTREPERWLAAADVVVCASDIEVLPLAVLQGMIMRRPAVSTAIFGLPEVVLEGRTGHLCRPCDVEDMARALGRILQDRRRIEQMGGEAADLVTGRHAIEPFVEAYASLLREAAGLPGA